MWKTLSLLVKKAYVHAKKRKNPAERELIGLDAQGNLCHVTLNTEKIVNFTNPIKHEFLRIDYKKIRFLKWEPHGQLLIKEAWINYNNYLETQQGNRFLKHSCFMDKNML